MQRGKTATALWISTALTALVTASAADAQVSFPADADAARLQERWEQRPEAQSQPLPETKRKKGDLEVPEPSVPSPSEQESSFLLKHIELNDAIADVRPLLQPLFKPYLSTQQSTKTLDALLKDILRRLRSEGYLLASVREATVDPDEGVLTLSLNLGQLNQVQYVSSEGTPPDYADSALLQLIRSRLEAASPLQVGMIERELLVLNSLPGLSAKGALVPGKEGVDLVITLQRKRWQGLLSLNNHGTNYVGPVQFNLGIERNGVLQPFDKLSLRGISAADNQELLANEIGYQMPLNSHGTSLDISALKTWSEPGFTLEPFRLESVSKRISVGVQHPLQRTLYKSLYVRGGAVLNDTRTKSFGAPISEDRLRSLYTGLQLDAADRWGGLNLADIALYQGINVLDATESGSSLLSRANGKSDYTRTEFFFTRRQPLPKRFTVTTSLTGQYALNQLLSSQEFGYGGRQFGRGYDPSEITGDHGIAGLLELSYAPAFRTPVWFNGLQYYTSYDAGAVWRIDTNTRQRQLTGASAAVGARANLGDTVALDIQLAKPLTRGNSAYSEENSNDPRLYGAVTVRF